MTRRPKHVLAPIAQGDMRRRVGGDLIAIDGNPVSSHPPRRVAERQAVVCEGRPVGKRRERAEKRQPVDLERRFGGAGAGRDQTQAGDEAGRYQEKS